MQPKFTPGPWEVQTGGSRGDEYYDIVTTRGDSEGTARILLTVDSDKRDAEANAHLIAAAPDLYATLSKLIEECRFGGGCDGEDPNCDGCEAIKAGRAALAKAEGRDAP